MRRTALSILLVLAGLGVEPAEAGPAALDCNLSAVAQETATGGRDTFTGQAHGYIGATGSNVSIRCFVRIDGVEASTTPTRGGWSAAVTAGQVTYTALPGSEVRLCADWTAGLEHATTCFLTNGPP